MKLQTLESLFATGEKTAILDALKTALANSSESPFWSEKVPPFCSAILSVLLPLKQQGLLFTPEGHPAQMSSDLFLRWCDLYSLKLLAFTLRQSNERGILCRTRYATDEAARYEAIELEELEDYLKGYLIDLNNECVDFPIAHYNLHTGITTVIKNML